MNIKFTYKSMLELLMYSSLFIAFSAVALVMSTYLILGYSLSSIPFGFLVIVFFSTLFIYNLNIFSICKFNKNPSGKELWKVENQILLKCILGLSFIIMCAGIYYFSWQSLLFLGHLGLLSLLYVNPFTVMGKTISLRRLPLLKIFVLSYVWASVTVLLPSLQFGVSDKQGMLPLLIERFLFIFALAIPFDVRDYSADKRSGVVTIPGRIGIDRAIFIAKMALVGFVIYAFSIHGISYISITRLLSAVIAFIFLQRANQNRNELFYLIGIDGLMIVHFIILCIVYVFK